MDLQEISPEVQKMSTEVQEMSTEIQEMPTEVPLLNPIGFYPGFPQIAEQIFDHMDKRSLKTSRFLSKSWQEYIDDQNLLWKKIIEYEDPKEAFQTACFEGHSKMAEFLILNSAKFNIDLNAKLKKKWLHRRLYPLFHLVCTKISAIFISSFMHAY